MNTRHARWIDYLQHFDFVIRHKAGRENKVADALSRRPHLLHMFSANIVGFESVKAEYTNDEDFGNIYNTLSNQEQTTVKEYVIREEFLFYKSRLCIPRGSF